VTRTESFETLDFLTDASILEDPAPYYAYLRECPVRRVPPHGVVAVTGIDEAVEVWRDSGTFSSCNSSSGPFPALTVEPGTDDITDLIEQSRDTFPLSEHLTTFDPPLHTQHRALLMRLMSPKRLEESEEFLWALADRLIDGLGASGRCEFIADYAYPFALLSVANLLGVPEGDHQLFLDQLQAYQAGALDKRLEGNPFAFMDDLFAQYVQDRRREPQQDIMTKMANATFPDGSLPEVIDVVRIAVFLFAAGQGTTAHLMGLAVQCLAERPDLQALLREDRDRIPAFVEEMLRLETPVKALFRLTRRSSDLGAAHIAANDTIMVMPGAANRDKRRFEDPDQLRLDRPNLAAHVAFGRGIHACPGGALARAEARISINRLLDRLGDITLSDADHGAAGRRHFDYVPSFLLRGLQELHLQYVPIG
jgi:cytochrome P450